MILILSADQYVPASEPLLVLAFVWSMIAIASEDPPDFVAPLLAIGGGIVSAVALLVQFSEGSQVLFMCIVAVLIQQRGRSRSLPTFAAVFVTIPRRRCGLRPAKAQATSMTT